ASQPFDSVSTVQAKFGAVPNLSAPSLMCDAFTLLRTLSSLNLSRTLQASFLDLDLSHLELLDLPRHCHRKRIHKANVLRDLEMRNLATAILLNLALSRRFLHPNPRSHALAQLRIR